MRDDKGKVFSKGTVAMKMNIATTLAATDATAAEANDLWRKRLKFELLSEILNKKSPDEATGVIRKRYERMLKNLDDIDGKVESTAATVNLAVQEHGYFRVTLDADVKDVRLSHRLEGSAACLVADERDLDIIATASSHLRSNSARRVMHSS